MAKLSRKNFLIFTSFLVFTFTIANSTALAQETIQASLVQTIDTSQFSPPSSDPAGITYLPTLNHLLISDSEVNEIPSIFTGDNLFEVTLSGSLVRTASTISFSDEPTGVTLNPANGHLFFSDDTGSRLIYELNPGADEIYGTADDTVTSFGAGASDPEGVAFDTQQGHLFVADGAGAEAYHLDPGANGLFGDGDDQVSHFDLASLGPSDPEGIAFNSQSGTLLIADRNSDIVSEITTSGSLIKRIDISAANARKPAGLTLAPGSTNPEVMNLYIVDRAGDNVNDGKLYELSFQEGPGPTLTPVPTSTPPASPTPTSLPISPTPTPPHHCLPLGDIDCSGKVNGIDFAYLMAHWGTTNPEANLDNADVVNATDALILLGNYGQTI